MSLEENLHICKLVDIYGRMLTETQFKTIKAYYFENLSLSEIGENFGITRQAVNFNLKQSLTALNNYESKLHILEKNEFIENELKSLDQNNYKSKVDSILDKIRE